MSTTQQEQTRAAASQEYLLEMRGITKAFAGVQALKGVDFYVRPGTVHALMGENGAGKSTLMKCLFGIYHKDEGTIKLRGQEVNFQSPHEALLPPGIGTGPGAQRDGKCLAGALSQKVWPDRHR